MDSNLYSPRGRCLYAAGYILLPQDKQSIVNKYNFFVFILQNKYISNFLAFVQKEVKVELIGKKKLKSFILKIGTYKNMPLPINLMNITAIFTFREKSQSSFPL